MISIPTPQELSKIQIIEEFLELVIKALTVRLEKTSLPTYITLDSLRYYAGNECMVSFINVIPNMTPAQQIKLFKPMTDKGWTVKWNFKYNEFFFGDKDA